MTADPVSEFTKAIEDLGIRFTQPIIADGTLHRYHVEGDKPHRRNGWAVLWVDGVKPAGAFGCKKRLGDGAIKWTTSKAVRVTPEERTAMRDAAARRAAAAHARAAAAAERAQALWATAVEAPDDHPYLRRKGVRSHGLREGPWEIVNPDTGEVTRITARALLVPIRDPGKTIHSLQAIFPSRSAKLGRDKDFLPGGAKRGLFFTIGRPVADTFFVCEGYATGASIHECTGHAVVVAFDAGNLAPVARVLRGRFPNHRIVIAADNDTATKGNPGVTYATAAATEVGALLVVPGADGADWNDVHAAGGPDEVRRQIDAVLAPPTAAAAAPIEPEVSAHLREDAQELPAAAEDDDLPVARIDNPFFTILGYDHDVYFFQTKEKRQVTAVTRGEIGSETTLLTLAPLQWWEGCFPGDKSKLNRAAAVNWLLRAVHTCGVYDPTCVRGRGAWMDRGRHIYHHGPYLSVDGAKADVHAIDSRYVYELARALPEPAVEPLCAADGAKLLHLASMFRWSKPGSAALLAGWCALAPICGALRWRPHIWLHGGAGAGKSTVLSGYVHHLTGSTALYAQGNSTEAGLRQTLGTDALPIVMDEGEQNDERETMRMQSIIALMRQSSTESQAQTLKGSASGAAVSYLVRSMFCLASIQVGLRHQADNERITLLSLRPKREDTDAAGGWQALSAALAELHADEDLPARLLRRAIDLIPTTLRNIKVFSAAAAHRFGSQREGDQYGTLLAGAWSLISSDVATPEQARAMIARYDWSEHAEHSDSDESDRALAALLESHIRIPGGADVTVFELVRAAAGARGGLDMEARTARDHLERYGMRVGDDKLILSNSSLELRRLISGTPYEADLRGILLRVAGADRYNNRAVKFNGVPSKAISLPLAPIIEDLVSSDDDRLIPPF